MAESIDKLKQADLDLVIDKMPLLSPRIKKSGSLIPITLKRPSNISSPILSARSNQSSDPVHDKFKKTIKSRYPTIQLALGTIDFSGKGSIGENDLVNFFKRFHFDYSDQELISYFHRYNLITKEGELDKAMMAKVFYGHHFRNNFETPGLVDAVMNPKSTKELNTQSFNELNSVISSRLIRIENMIKTKISSNWNQVRKAFLDIDSDYDGFITAKDLEEL